MWKKPMARKLVHDFFADPDKVIICKDSDGATYMTDRCALVHVNSPAFPARWYANLDEGVYKVRAAGDPVPDADITDHHRAAVLAYWQKLAHVTDWRPVEPTPWRRDGFMRLMIRHDTSGDRAIFAHYDRIEAFTSARPPYDHLRFTQPAGKPGHPIRITAESTNGVRNDLIGYLAPAVLTGPIGRSELKGPLQQQADAIMAAYQQHPAT